MVTAASDNVSDQRTTAEPSLMAHQQGLQRTVSRRVALQSVGAGFGTLALHGLLSATTAAAVPRRAGNPLAELPAHHHPTAKRCIFIYLPGGPSQIDLFDPKPEVARRHGQPLPFQMPDLVRTRTKNLYATSFLISQAWAKRDCSQRAVAPTRQLRR